MIRMHSASKAFASKRVLDNMNLDIAKGSVFGLVGPNGSGKSTILRLLSGIYKLDQGFAMIDDQPVYDNVALKRRLFFVADEPYFFNHATLYDMKQFYQMFYTNFDEELYKRLLKIFPINEKSKITAMSKGMQRQVLLIIALSTSPDYLFLDEAFDGLDPVMRLALKRIIGEEVANRNMSVIISSHNLRELEDICDCLGLLSQGKIDLVGSIEDLKNKVNKVQLALHSAIEKEDLLALNVLHFEKSGSFVTFVVKNTEEEIRAVVNEMNPVFFELLPVSLEEIFVYEMEAQGYGQYSNE